MARRNYEDLYAELTRSSLYADFQAWLQEDIERWGVERPGVERPGVERRGVERRGLQGEM